MSSTRQTLGRTQPTPHRVVSEIRKRYAAVGEAYLDGDLDAEGDLADPLTLRPIFSDLHPWQYLTRYARRGGDRGSTGSSGSTSGAVSTGSPAT